MYSINHQFGANASQFDVSERMSKIEARNRQQGQEISVLKTRAIEDRNEISELRNRVAQLESFPSTTNSLTKLITIPYSYYSAVSINIIYFINNQTFQNFIKFV